MTDSQENNVFESSDNVMDLHPDILDADFNIISDTDNSGFQQNFTDTSGVEEDPDKEALLTSYAQELTLRNNTFTEERARNVLDGLRRRVKQLMEPYENEARNLASQADIAKHLNTSPASINRITQKYYPAFLKKTGIMKQRGNTVRFAFQRFLDFYSVDKEFREMGFSIEEMNRFLSLDDWNVQSLAKQTTAMAVQEKSIKLAIQAYAEQLQPYLQEQKDKMSEMSGKLTEAEKTLAETKAQNDMLLDEIRQMKEQFNTQVKDMVKQAMDEKQAEEEERIQKEELLREKARMQEELDRKNAELLEQQKQLEEKQRLIDEAPKKKKGFFASLFGGKDE